MKETEESIRAKSTQDLLFVLKEGEDYYGQDGLFVACDELIHRKVKLRGLKIRFESLVKNLNARFLKRVDLNDFKFSKASIQLVIHEMKKRSLKPMSWFSAFRGEKSGPHDRLEIDQMIQSGEISSEHLVWKEGMKSWVELRNLPHLNEPYFFDQEIEDRPAPIEKPDEMEEKSIPGYQQMGSNAAAAVLPATKTSSIPTFLGIFQFISIPFWIVMVFVSLATGIGSFIGMVLPFMISLFMLIMSVPLGIGLLGRRKWAYSVKVVSSIMVLVWFAGRTLIDEASFVWIGMAAFELIMLIFALTSTDQFDR